MSKPLSNLKLESAKYLANHGLTVIPLKASEKVPIVSWSKYQGAKPSEDDLEQWFAKFPDRNIGVVCGAGSGVVVLDVDKPEAFHLVMPRTPTVKTGKGLHYYFKHPGFDVGNASLPFGDLRGDGGQVVAPPSLHPNGSTYEWLVSPDDAPLAELPSELIELAFKPSLAANDNDPADETTPYGKAWFQDVERLARETEGGRNTLLNEASCKAGSLISGGQLSERDARVALIAACKANGIWQADGSRQCLATISSGIKAGSLNPRFPAETETVGSEPQKPGKLMFRKASSITAEKVEWLWPGVLPKNSMSILAGNPGLGKSQVSLSIAATITSGGRWPVTGERAPVGNVIILSGEDSAEHTIIPRLVAAGADLDRVFILDMVTSDDGSQRQFNLQDDIPKLREALDEIGDVSLIVIDVLNAYLAKADTNNSGDVRRITNDLTHLANAYDLCILGLAHLNKSEGRQASHRVQGSVSWVGAARTVWLVEKDDDGGRTMSPIKNNLAKDNQAFSFDVVSKDLHDGIATSLVAWGNSSQTKTADQALADRADGAKTQEAKNFLRAMLANDPLDGADVKAKAAELGISSSTLNRAAQDIGVVYSSNGPRSYLWSLPKAA